MAGAGSLVEFGWCSVAWVMLGGVCLGELGWCVLACRLWDVGWCLAVALWSLGGVLWPG